LTAGFRFRLGFARRVCNRREGRWSMAIVIGGTMAAINASSTTCATRHNELLAPASNSA
jgi:hypothetical protein